MLELLIVRSKLVRVGSALLITDQSNQWSVGFYVSLLRAGGRRQQQQQQHRSDLRTFAPRPSSCCGALVGGIKALAHFMNEKGGLTCFSCSSQVR